MHRIEIDDDVYAVLEGHVKGFERPNDVLRRLLLKDAARVSATTTVESRIQGRLYPLIAAGYVKGGDELTCHQPRKGRTFTAHVDEAGFVVHELGVFKEPSPALVKFTGSQIDGWANWIHVPSGSSLRNLRLALEQKG